MKMTVFTDHLRLKGLFSNEFYEMKMTLMNPCLTLEPSLITMFIETLPGKPKTFRTFTAAFTGDSKTAFRNSSEISQRSNAKCLEIFIMETLTCL